MDFHLILFIFLLNLHPVNASLEQCKKEIVVWKRSLKSFATVSSTCIISKNCTVEEQKILRDDLYAIEQYDSWGKIPSSGLFQGPLLLDGSYQECERISDQKYETNYCYMMLVPGKNKSCQDVNPSFTIRRAVCMPYSCSQHDLPTVYNQFSTGPLTACSAYCSKYPVKKTSAFWGYTSFLGVMIGIALFATTWDYLKTVRDEEDQNLALRIFLSFSFWTNSELLLSVKDPKAGFIKCLDCIRFFSMLWVITGHCFQYLTIPDQVITVSQIPLRFWNHVVGGALFSVDTFLVISGTTVSYLFFKQNPKKSQIKHPATWIFFYLHRYLRLTPPLMIFIGFFTVYGYYIQGPGVASLMSPLNPQVDICVTNWWKNLFYINNLGSDKDQCFAISWYLGVDTQLYVIAPIFLTALYFSFAAGAMLLIAGMVGSIITVYILYGIYDFPSDFIGKGDVTHFYDLIYVKPWIRAPPYLVGLFVGYFLATFGKRRIRLNWMVAVLGWVAAFLIGFTCIFVTYFYHTNGNWSILTRATYYNFSRLGWAMAVSWVIVANHMGWGGPINNFMSHPIWQPFGRLSYCAYIVHYFVLYFYLKVGVGSMHYYSSFQMFMQYAIPTALISYIFAFFWSCLFEVPFLRLEKLLLEKMTFRFYAK